jgi:hypothetical protein
MLRCCIGLHPSMNGTPEYNGPLSENRREPNCE